VKRIARNALSAAEAIVGEKNSCPKSKKRRELIPGLEVHRPGAVVVEDGFFEKGVVEDFDHLAVTADPRDPERCPNILPGYELHVHPFADEIRSLIQ
jgi:hypothetical protein